jgi:hypothetical protein
LVFDIESEYDENYNLIVNNLSLNLVFFGNEKDIISDIFNIEQNFIVCINITDSLKDSDYFCRG